MYSLGILGYEITTIGRMPFIGASKESDFNVIWKGNYKILKGTSEVQAFIIHSLIRFERNDRLTLDQLISPLTSV